MISGYASHAIDHLNDETYGNTHSWIGNSVNSFAGVAFDDAYAIDQIAFGRDNGDPPGEANQYVDRYAGIYTLQYTMAEIGTVDETLADSEWITIANLTYDSTSPDTTGYLRHLWNFPRIDGCDRHSDSDRQQR